MVPRKYQENINQMHKELKAIQNEDELDWKQYNTWNKIKSAPKKVKRENWRKNVKVYYIEGPSGAGKTNKIEEIMEQEGVEDFEELKHIDGFWHGIVDGTGCAVYDDWRDSHMSASEFINFIDYRSHNLNVKGGGHRNNYSIILISSVQPLDSIYSGVSGEPREQWIRRIQRIQILPPDIY